MAPTTYGVATALLLVAGGVSAGEVLTVQESPTQLTQLRGHSNLAADAVPADIQLALESQTTPMPLHAGVQPTVHNRRESSIATITGGTNAFDRCYTYTATPATSYEYATLDSPMAPGTISSNELSLLQHTVRSEVLVQETIDVKKVRVRVNITAHRPGRFEIVLGAKSKRSIGAYRETVLAARRGGNQGQTFNDVLFTDDADEVRGIADDMEDDGYGLVFTPQTGRVAALAGGGVFAPEQTLESLAVNEGGATSIHAGLGGSRGVWALQMRELAGNEEFDACIESWSLTLCGPPLDEGAVEAEDAERCGFLCRLTRPIAQLFGRTSS